ncbi:UDP-glycosyltransferase UGT5-like [Pieris brassicae]|uniref:UDP-glycosyltransferase UGT5-like n=1 Tax=Pieris brassicae TaxID=7116 RepID=UPI001E65F01A|nr:UDP-glycosyltransferase UGT5-like [Pieris brassicae]XP_045530281.1 UDP-glycosyltransferase UGT5-like [Pieris brassicae]XP_045530283.1 UDP-glycosyltransferase UGT5-like [Pieris brassicae]
MKQLYLLCLLVTSAVSYKILCIHMVPSKSHFHLVNGVVQPLLKAGHKIVLATPFPEAVKNHNNITVIDLSSHNDFLKNIDMSDPNVNMGNVISLSRDMTLATVRKPVIQEMLVKDQFDAVVTEWFFTDIDAGYAAILQVPWIVLSGNVINYQVEQLVHTVTSVPIIPSIHTDYPMPMSFWHRLQSTISYATMMIYEWKSYQLFKSDYEENFGPLAAARGIPLPPFEETYRNVSILLSDSHPSFSPARSIPPNLVEIAGYHIDANIPQLPEDLKQLLDASPQGVIYFSMGSVLKASAFKGNTKKELLQVFGSLKQTVLWKLDEKIDGLPKNVHVRPWMPQSSILAHPNVKIFITHGGLLSTMESLHYGIPILTIPVFADQPHNAARSIEAGRALRVKYSPEMAPDVKIALQEMLRNDSYYKKAKELSKLFRNRLNKPSDLITHYVEMAIETKGALHLRSVIKQYQWYEYLMLDQLLFICIILYIIYSIIRKMLSASKISKRKND